MCRSSSRRLALLLVLLCACREAVEPSPVTRPDLVLVSIDSLRADHLGAYGYARPTSPTFDRLAAGGVRFAQAVSTTSWTLPAHAALFTGLYDSAHGLVDNGLRMADAHVTLAEVLREHGYHTAGFFGAPYLHPTFGLDQGFDVYQSCMTPELASAESARADSFAASSFAHADVTGPRTLAAVQTWLEDLGERPFFLFLHLWDVHYDYIPPREYVQLFDPDYTGHVDGRNFFYSLAIHPGMPARDREHVIALYDAEIRFTDDILGRVLDALEARGRLRDTVVVVTADHGEEFFEHGGKGHQRTLYEEVVRVPLVVSWPGRLPGGVVVEDPVRLIDVMPTVLALAGLPAPPRMQGRDLAPLWRGEPLAEQPALTELLVAGRSLRALRTARYKWFAEEAAEPAHGYDLARDPGEGQPIQAPQEELARGLARLHQDLDSSLALRRELGGDPVAAEAGDSLWERLRALGYVEEAEPGSEPVE
jgi:arylsulfatase A-like enzyme